MKNLACKGLKHISANNEISFDVYLIQNQTVGLIFETGCTDYSNDHNLYIILALILKNVDPNRGHLDRISGKKNTETLGMAH